MPIQVEERDAGQILYVAFADVWETGDLKQAVATIQAHLDRATHPVRLVVDARATFQVPLGALGHVPMGRSSLAPVLITDCVVIGGTSVTRSIAQAAFRLCHLKQFVFVETEEQAWNQVRDSIPYQIPM